MVLVHLRATAGRVASQAVRLRHAAVAVFLLVAADVVHAHDEPFSFVDVVVEEQALRGQVAAHAQDLAHEMGLATPDSLCDVAFVRRSLPQIHQVFERLLQLSADGAPVRPHWTAHSFSPERRTLRLQWESSPTRPPATIQLRGPLFTYEAAHQTYFNVHVNGAVVHQDLLDSGHTVSEYATGIAPSRFAVVVRFIREGVHHIFIGPDHILFIVGLMLCGGRVRRLLQIVTGFTLAHSVTLALAALGLVTPPARLIESAIALSIIYVGADNLLRGQHGTDRRAWIAAGFGLVHGFGFANVLGDVGLPRQALAWALAAFNIGVEIGQACIVLAVAPLLLFLRARQPRFGRSVVTAGSAIVIAAGAYWFVQRAFFA